MKTLKKNIKKCHIFFLFIFLSCSFHPPSKENVTQSKMALDVLASSMTQLCISGEGRGRFETPNESQTFNYESLLVGEKNFWKMAISVPFYGEEFLEIDWSGIRQDVVKHKGSFLNKMLEKNQSQWPLKNHFNEFFDELGKFLHLYSLYKDDKDPLSKKNVTCYLKMTTQNKENEKSFGGSCHLQRPPFNSFDWVISPTKLSLMLKLKKDDSQILIEGLRSKGSFYREIIFSYNNKLLPLHFFLYPRSCLN